MKEALPTLPDNGVPLVEEPADLLATSDAVTQQAIDNVAAEFGVESLSVPITGPSTSPSCMVVSEEELMAFVDGWISHVAQTQECLQMRADSMQKHDGGVSAYGGNLSIMEACRSRRPELVHWQPGHRRGRFVPCRGGKWTYVVASEAYPVEDLANDVVIMPYVGIRMDKPKMMRSPLPPPWYA